MKFSATFEEKVKKAEEQGDRPLVSSYLNTSKVDPKEPVSFALLEEDPLIFWKIYGESVHGDKGKSFRFVSKPTEEEILTEMGGSFKEALNSKAKIQQILEKHTFGLSTITRTKWFVS